MALNPILDSLDGLDESLASHYTETDGGKYRLDVTPADGWALEDVAALRTALESNKHKRGQLAEQLAQFKNDDGEFHDIQALLDAQTQLTELRSGKQEEVEELVKQRIAEAQKRHDAEVQKHKTENETLSKDLDYAVRVQAALTAIGEAGASKYSKVLLPQVLDQLEMRRGEDNKPFAAVVGKDGAARLSPANPTQDMSLSELLGEMSNDEAFSVMFEGSGATGSGAPQPGAPGKGGFRINSADLRDQKKYQAAKKAAEEAGQTLQVV